MTYWLLEKEGVVFSIETNLPSVDSFIQEALDGLSLKKAFCAQGIRLSVKFDGGVWCLFDHDCDLRFQLKYSGDLIYHLTDRIVFHIASTLNQLHCVHAAAVSNQGHAIAIPANSGAGKSSLTCWLVANGFLYLSDELVLLNHQGFMSGVARPIQIKPHGLDAVASLLVYPEKVYKGEIANAIPVKAFNGACHVNNQARLSMMLFPLYEERAGFEFKQLSSAQAGMRLMKNHVNARSLQGHGFKEMMAMVRNIPCYSLTYGGFATMPDAFAEQLKAICGLGNS